MKNDVTEITKNYYDSKDAINFYFEIWGGEDIHIGIYDNATDSIAQASRKTVERICSTVDIDSSTKIVDLGSGYGGGARYLVKKYQCHVTCLNLSLQQNEINEQLCQKHQLQHLIDIKEGNFEDMPFGKEQFDLAWSQDAMLHSGNRGRVLQEAYRILKPQGKFVFTDIMQSENCDPSQLKQVYERIHLDSMGTFEFYETHAKQTGFSVVQKIDLSQNIAKHYQKVLDDTLKNYDHITTVCSKEYIDKMIAGLKVWVESSNKQLIKWGIICLVK